MSVYGEGSTHRRTATLHEPCGAPPMSGRALGPGGDEDGAPLAAVPTDERKRPDLASIYALTKYAQERRS
jgi:dTDP-L-rhamnose 4-epimerase